MQIVRRFLALWAPEKPQVPPRELEPLPEIDADAPVLDRLREMHDNALWLLWPLETVMAQSPSEHGVMFSDYGIDCWQYHLRPISAEESAVYVDYCDGKPPRLVAFTLMDFFESYLADADTLMAG